MDSRATWNSRLSPTAVCKQSARDGFNDAGGGIDVQPDGQVKCRDSHRLRSLRSIEQPLAFRQLNLDPQSLLLLQSSAFFQVLGHVQVVFPAPDRILSGLFQSPRAEYLIVR